MSTPDDSALFGVQAVKPRGGPLYQGVCKTIRALIKEGILDDKIDAGPIAQARALAASIDRVDGHDLSGHQASGIQLGAMHEQLGKVLERLNPAGESDEFQDWLNDLDKEAAPDGPATAPHPEV